MKRKYWLARSSFRPFSCTRILTLRLGTLPLFHLLCKCHHRLMHSQSFSLRIGQNFLENFIPPFPRKVHALLTYTAGISPAGYKFNERIPIVIDNLKAMTLVGLLPLQFLYISIILLYPSSISFSNSKNVSPL